MCRGPLPYGHAGATRIFSDSAGSFAARRRAKDHTNECEKQRERRGRAAGETERNDAGPVVDRGGNGDGDGPPWNHSARDRGPSRTELRARRSRSVTDNGLIAAGGGHRADGRDGEATRRRRGRDDRGVGGDARAAVTGGRRRRHDQGRVGG